MFACLLSLERRTDRAIEVSGSRINNGADAASKQVACYSWDEGRMYRAQRICTDLVNTVAYYRAASLRAGRATSEEEKKNKTFPAKSSRGTLPEACCI